MRDLWNPSKRLPRWLIRTLTVAVCVALLGALASTFWYARKLKNVEAAYAKLDGKQSRLVAERAWYRWFYSEYAAAMRLDQYREPTLDINELLHQHSHEFIPIESVTTSVVCPRESHGPFTGDYIYFGARTMPLPGKDGLKFFAMSYLGSAGFAHNGKGFDAIVGLDDLRTPLRKLQAPFGLVDAWLGKYSWRDFQFEKFGDYGFSALMSYNAGDIDGDEQADFVLGRALVLSSKGYGIAGEAPRRAMFQGERLLAIEGNELTTYRWMSGSLERVGAASLKSAAHSNLPYVLLPLPGARVGVRTAAALDVYDTSKDSPEWFASITGLSPGEVQTGGFGDFSGNGEVDVWLAQVATPTPYPGKKDQIVLLQMADVRPGTNSLPDIAWFTVVGASKYSDYDGIGSTLSPKAGDITGDGRADLSFTGHRHMNEAGALYVLPGDALSARGSLDVTDPKIVKILGRPMSQLAPPFHHWDADDVDGDGISDIIVTVDNDLCSGLNAGAVYTLSGAAITRAWKAKG